MEEEQARAIIALLHDAGVCAYFDNEAGAVEAWANGHPRRHVEVDASGVTRTQGVFYMRDDVAWPFSARDARRVVEWLSEAHR